MRLLMLIAALLISDTGPAGAGPFEDGGAAYDKGDYATALRLWRPLADQGDARAQTNLGLMYYTGQGGAKDLAAAVSWYRKAAEQGDAAGQHGLGFLYDEGVGVPQDNAAAMSWYRKAAEQGLAASQKNLGLKYYRGQGVPQDYLLAHMWLNLAAAQGADGASKARDIVAAQMTPAQIAEAQKLAREWKPK